MENYQSWEVRQEQIRKSRLCNECYSWLGEGLNALKEKTFDNYQRELFPHAYDLLRAFTEHTDEKDQPVAPRVNFVIFGNFGTGKTHLLLATMNALRKHLVPCKFMTGQGLFDAISRSIGQHHDYQCYIDQASSTPVLAIDDIDKVHIPERTKGTEDNFQVKTFFAILNKRYMKKLPTLITTNAMDITPYVGSAGFSRLKECGRFVEMEGKDFRDSMMIW
jgi:DNA replication protein DnaC